LIFHLMESDSSTGNLSEDLLGSSSPDEWFRVIVVSFQVILDRGDEVINAVEHTPANSLVSQVPESPFNQVKPR
jgi:hypothetical protein